MIYFVRSCGSTSGSTILLQSYIVVKLLINGFCWEKFNEKCKFFKNILISFIFTFQRRSRSLLDNDELKKLYSVLEANSATPEDEFSSICEDNLMDYESFLKAKSLSSSKCQQYFKPMIFAKLQHGDPHGRISVMAFFNYVMRKVYSIFFI